MYFFRFFARICKWKVDEGREYLMYDRLIDWVRMKSFLRYKNNGDG